MRSSGTPKVHRIFMSSEFYARFFELNDIMTKGVPGAPFERLMDRVWGLLLQSRLRLSQTLDFWICY